MLRTRSALEPRGFCNICNKSHNFHSLWRRSSVMSSVSTGKLQQPGWGISHLLWVHVGAEFLCSCFWLLVQVSQNVHTACCSCLHFGMRMWLFRTEIEIPFKIYQEGNICEKSQEQLQHLSLQREIAHFLILFQINLSGALFTYANTDLKWEK